MNYGLSTQKKNQRRGLMANEIQKYLGIKVQTLRKSNHLTQEDLAAKCNVSWRTISNLERGFVMPELRLVLSISKIFNTGLDELFGFHTEESISIMRLKKEVEIFENIKRLNGADLDYIGKTIDLFMKCFY